MDVRIQLMSEEGDHSLHTGRIPKLDFSVYEFILSEYWDLVACTQL